SVRFLNRSVSSPQLRREQFNVTAPKSASSQLRQQTAGLSGLNVGPRKKITLADRRARMWAETSELV
ncbi:hypothetical protein, partial [Paraburkholderia sp. UYCP14C]|uniref:hypothetical protein n=1 Tax=Paraburkholderia sp. UYCP14C TaxID=2511130 RepID=UPI001B7D6549